MITVLHGEDVSSLDKKYSELIQASSWVLHISGDTHHVNDVRLGLLGQELFSERKIVVIQAILKFAKKELEEVISQIMDVKNNSEVQVIILNYESLDKKFLEKLKGATVFSFPLPKYFFTFLDGFVPGNKKLLHQTLENLSIEFSAEQVFYSLTKRVRLLMMVKVGNASNYKEIEKMSTWQLGKLSSQAARWNYEDLKKIYQRLFQLEVKRKSSELSLPLHSALDMLLLTEL